MLKVTKLFTSLNFISQGARSNASKQIYILKEIKMKNRFEINFFLLGV